MTQLVYLSLTKWNTYEERPHHFVRWFHERTGGRVLWVNPYPSRLPNIKDLRNLNRRALVSHIQNNPPTWLTVLNLNSLPIEPLPMSGVINNIFWTPAIKKIRNFIEKEKTLIAVGKPSIFANHVLASNPDCSTLFDIMDSYPDFYSGLARDSVKKQEEKLVKHVDKVSVSSSNLLRYWEKYRDDITLVHNGIKPISLTKDCWKGKFPPAVFGYVGSISSWFDWELVRQLAICFPNDPISLIGPMYSKPNFKLPQNIRIMPAVSQQDALVAMRSFKVGIIPFRLNRLTENVDPVKYYEYTFSGIPTLSTGFGEMAFRSNCRGVFIVKNNQDIKSLAMEAKKFAYSESEIAMFTQQCSWNARFDHLNLQDITK